ncbi:hypothetical protein ACPPVT_11045 [Angustibacter sp. McL0619]|uniref:hypothetical protein n=1 Tax=Angustibacter sp. McL0619 TaxID=3415676 RepID=UPI003CF81B96
MNPLPRAAVLALWAGPVLSGRANAGALLRAVQGDDERHEVATADASQLEPLALPGRLGELLAGLRDQHVRALRLVLPVPGDPSALPGPASVNEAAIEAGECLVTVGGPPIALIPEVYEFGSVYEVGHQVIWQVVDCSPPVAPLTTTVGEAERELREALLRATDALHDLDLARWRPDASDRIDDLRQGADVPWPSSTPPRAVRVLDLAWRVRSIVELAREDDGAAVNGWEATRRDEELRQLDDVSRRALVAAVNSPIHVPD